MYLLCLDHTYPHSLQECTFWFLFGDCNFLSSCLIRDFQVLGYIEKTQPVFSGHICLKVM